MNQPPSDLSPAEAILNRMMEVVRATALAEMASGIAHEVNQPLGAIAAFAQAGQRMLDRPTPLLEAALDVFRQINQEALNAGNGIRRIRGLFSPDEAPRSACSLDELITELRPVLELLAKRVAGHLEVHIESQGTVLVDRARIQHVLFTLVQNGFDAAAAISVSPKVRIVVAQDRYAVETSIFDPGSGVPNGAHAQLFRPFYSTKARGTGLGLASSRAILESHDGTIGFENIAAGGCRFWFRLPLAETGIIT